MDEKPKRCWWRIFRIRLSTILILTAIAAWAMATPLFYYKTTQEVFASNWQNPGRMHAVVPNHARQIATVTWRSFNPNALYPAIALATFVAWKAAWRLVERRRSGRATQP